MKPEDKGSMGGGGGRDSASGQQKVYTVTNPATGEVRTGVTQRQWREEKLGKQGFEKPADMPEEGVTEEQPPAV